MEKVERFGAIAHGLEDGVKVIMQNCIARSSSNPTGVCVERLDLELQCLEDCIEVSNGKITDTIRGAFSYISKYAMSGYLLTINDGNSEASALANEMTELYARKNRDYGNSFDKSMDKFGLVVAAIRIGDKVNRLQSLISKRGEAEVKDESLADTFMDTACYAIMSIMWTESKESEDVKGEIYSWYLSCEHVDEIPKEQAAVGDYAYTDGDSGFCHGSYSRIVGFSTRYNTYNGKPFKIVKLEDDEYYRFDNGRCIKGAKAYRIIKYARLKPGVVILSDD